MARDCRNETLKRPNAETRRGGQISPKGTEGVPASWWPRRASALVARPPAPSGPGRRRSPSGSRRPLYAQRSPHLDWPESDRRKPPGQIHTTNVRSGYNVERTILRCGGLLRMAQAVRAQGRAIDVARPPLRVSRLTADTAPGPLCEAITNFKVQISGCTTREAWNRNERPLHQEAGSGRQRPWRATRPDTKHRREAGATIPEREPNVCGEAARQRGNKATRVPQCGTERQ